MRKARARRLWGNRFSEGDNSENERNPNLDHNLKKGAQELGYTRTSMYEAFESARKDKYGDEVSHQDSVSSPCTRHIPEKDEEVW